MLCLSLKKCSWKWENVCCFSHCSYPWIKKRKKTLFIFPNEILVKIYREKCLFLWRVICGLRANYFISCTNYSESRTTLGNIRSNVEEDPFSQNAVIKQTNIRHKVLLALFLGIRNFLEIEYQSNSWCNEHFKTLNENWFLVVPVKRWATLIYFL